MNWKEFIEQESGKEYYSKLYKFLFEEGKTNIIYPPHNHLMSAFKLCPLDKVKVIILGQDPYHGPNQAHGLSFSVPPGEAIPPSLKNIFKEIKSDLSLEKNFTSGNLTGWAEQGVLLLNSILTVRANQAGSHREHGWEKFTDEAIKLINGLDSSVVFMLWGGFAKSKKKLITNPQHLVLEAAHPSPLSAHNGFLGCKHFSKTNEFLISKSYTPINWGDTESSLSLNT